MSWYGRPPARTRLRHGAAECRPRLREADIPPSRSPPVAAAVQVAVAVAPVPVAVAHPVTTAVMVVPVPPTAIVHELELAARHARRRRRRRPDLSGGRRGEDGGCRQGERADHHFADHGDYLDGLTRVPPSRSCGIEANRI